MSDFISSVVCRLLSPAKSLASLMRGLQVQTSHPRSRCAFVFSVIALVAMFAMVPPSAAQTELAGVSGRITDQSGAVIVDAEVEIKNVETNVSTMVKTNRDGLYTIPSLHPGNYLVNVRKPGFKSVTVTEVTLNVQDNVVRNFALQIGSVSETVTVSAGGLNINTTDAAVGTTIDRQFVENLPLNGRSFQSLIDLTPGVVLTPNNGEDNGQFSVNGQRAVSNYWMVDGVSANIGTSGVFGPGNGLGGTLSASSVTGGTNSLVSVDALQEFRIQTSTYAPEFGRTPGGQISIVTRSGTNEFHGVAFDYFRNTVLDANNWFNGYMNNPPLPKAKEQQNDFGGTFGGPILKDRTFFFFSYEGLRLRLPQTTLTTVPCDNSCAVFGNARASAAPAIQPFLNAYPLPTGQEVFTPCTPASNPSCPASGQESTGAAQFNASYSNPASLDAYSIRIDHKLTDRFSIFGRYNDSPSSAQSRPVALSSIQETTINTRTATIGADWFLSPTITNTLRFNYSQTDASVSQKLDSFGGAVPLMSSSIPFPAGYSLQNSGFNFAIYGLQGGFLEAGKNGHNIQRQYNVVDALSVQAGSHSLKFGADLRFLSPIFDPRQYSQQAYFSDVPTAQTGTLLFGFITASNPAKFLFPDVGFFGQDTWRVNARLTATYGLRWDIEFPPSSLSGPSLEALSGFNLRDLSTVTLASVGTPPFHTRYGNIAPRLGIAYQWSQKPGWIRVLRGGVGLFYDLSTSEIGNIFQTSNPFWASKSPGGTYPLPPADVARPVIDPALSRVLSAPDPNLNLPHTLEWNVAIEQSLGTSQSLSVSYVGAKGRNLLQTAAVFSPNPNVAYLQFVTNAGTSDYNALQVQFNRHLAHGLQALASYTWAHSIDTASAGSTFNTSNSLVLSDLNANRGPSDFDIRDAFTLGVTYNVPAPKIDPIGRIFLKDWSVQSIVLASSAPPVDIQDTNFSNLNDGVQIDIRPDLVPGQPLYLHGPQYPGGKAFNSGAFQDPPVDPNSGNPTRNGNIPRNFVRGFAATQWDVGIHRDFPIRETLKLQFRAEMFNVLNHPIFGQPSGLFGLGGFGLSSQTLNQYLGGGFGGATGAFNPLYQIGGPRSIQLALKLQF